MRLLLPAVAWLCGCASPGVPKPPSLRLPEKAANLEVRRVGTEVRLTWTTPANTTDGEAIRGMTTAVICRGSAALPPTQTCNVVRQLAVMPGASALQDTLPGTMRVGADFILEYRVELRNDRGRSAGVSEPAFAASGRAPETPAGVTARPRPEGVLVTWEPDAGGAAGVETELRRTRPGAARVEGDRKKQAVPFAAAKPPAGEVVLVADGSRELGGMVDRSAKYGETYAYAAERVRTVRIGGRTLELRSVAAAPVTVTYRNTFPPQAPTGLITVPGGGFGAALSVDLSWETNAEPNVVGYRVYRSVDGGKSVLLTDKPVEGVAYRDLHVAAGHAYGYRVSAVDGHGNESAPGAEAREMVR